MSNTLKIYKTQLYKNNIFLTCHYTYPIHCLTQPIDVLYYDNSEIIQESVKSADTRDAPCMCELPRLIVH